MKACVLESENNLVCKDVSAPQVRLGEVLIDVKACGICSSDLDRVFKGGAYHYPLILGHEFSGEIVDVASDVPRDYISKRVVVFPLLPCMNCYSCRKEHYAQCSHYNYLGSRCNGAFAEQISVPLWNCRTFAPSLDFRIAALCEPAAVAYHAVVQGNVRQNTSVCIVGTGAIAVLCGIWAREKGARVIFICRNERKRIFLNNMGFEECILDCTGSEQSVKKLLNGEGADIAMECVGTDCSLESAILSLKQRGTLVLVGNPEGDKYLKKEVYWKLLRSEITMKGTWNSSFASYDDEWTKVIHGLEKSPSLFRSLITHQFSLDKCQEAFRVLSDEKEFSIKGMFYF